MAEKSKRAEREYLCYCAVRAVGGREEHDLVVLHQALELSSCLSHCGAKLLLAHLQNSELNITKEFIYTLRAKQYCCIISI